MKCSRRDFLRMSSITGVGLFTGCQSLHQVVEAGAEIAHAGGYLSEDETDAITKSSQAIAHSYADFTPQQVHYIGRTIAALVIDRYPLYEDFRANHYLNLVGRSLTDSNQCALTYSGYHLYILDSQEINALSTPGGFILLTRGLLGCCPDEEALAAVLAHEIAHVNLNHGLSAIRASRITDALSVIGSEAVNVYGSAEAKQLSQAFSGTIHDIATTLIDNGYSRQTEYEADELAVTYLKGAGYQPAGIYPMLQQMETKLVPGRGDFASTHPTPKQRMETLANYLPDRTYQAPPVRKDRFNQELLRNI